MNIKLVFKYLWKKKWFLIIISILSASIVFYLTYSEKIYKSKAQVATGFTLKEDNINGKENAAEAEVKFNNLIETFNSPLIVGILSYELIVHELTDPSPFRTNDFNLDNKLTLSPNEKDLAIETFQRKISRLELLKNSKPFENKLLRVLNTYGYDYEALTKNLKINRLNYSDYVEIQFQSENPQLSAFVVNTISQGFIRYYNSLSLNVADQSTSFYENLVKKTKEVLDRKTLELDNYRSNNNVINVEVESGSKYNQLAELELRKQQENQNLQKYLLELDNINKQLSGLVQGPSISSRGRDNNRIAELQNKIKEANQRYISSDRDPGILTLVEDLRRQLQIELGKSDITPANIENKRNDLLVKKNTAELNLQITQSALSQINSAIGRTKSNVSGLTSKGSTLEELTRQVQKANEEYLAALEKFNNVKNQTLVATTSVRQVVYGQPAIQAEPTNNLFYTTIAGILAFGITFFSLIIIEISDSSIKTPSNFRKKTSIEPLGYISQISTTAITPEILNKRPVGKEHDFILFKELLKKLRFEIENSGGKSFLFTSTKVQDGKTSIIISLASAMIANGKKVLIIDTNFKNNTLTKSYAAKPTLETAINKELALDELVTKTNYKNLDVIGCKGGNYSPSEIFPDKKLGNFISLVSPKYDFIFLEGTFLNQYADSKELVAYIDKVLAITSAKTSIKHSDKESFSYLKGLNDKFMGVVLNKVEKDYLDL